MWPSRARIWNDASGSELPTTRSYRSQRPREKWRVARVAHERASEEPGAAAGYNVVGWGGGGGGVRGGVWRGVVG
jgi:hypothetical protein